MELRPLSSGFCHLRSAAGKAMNDTPWLSAIIPNYNDSRLLPRAISALASQDPPPAEIIVVDDGSTDDSLRVIERLRLETPSLKLLRNERNLGVIPTLNRGLAAARGRYVYLGSANDSVAPGFFAIARRMLEAHPDCGFFSAECRIVDGTGRAVAVRPPARPAQRPVCVPPHRVPALLRRIDNVFPSSSVVLRRAAAEEAGGLDPALISFADGYLMRAVALRHGFCFAPTIGANWTIDTSGASLTTASRADIALGVLEAAQAKMRDDRHFPPSYLDLFEGRWRFGAGRVNAGADRPTLRALAPVVAPGRAEAAAWRLMALVPGRAGRLARLIWLTLRFRPFALSAIAATQFARLLEKGRTPGQTKDQRDCP